MTETRVLMPSAGIRLEGLMRHRGASSGRGVVLCHPHPQFGGDMHNPVVSEAAEAAFLEGYSTLRFNFRGVGESEGSYGEGVGEKEDVEAAIQFMSAALHGSDPFLVLAGYSFGAWTGLQVAAEDPRVKAMVGIAPPLGIYDFGFLRRCSKSKLIIAGDRDMYCPRDVLEKWFEELEEPKSLAVLPGADHFLFSHLHALSLPLRNFFHHSLAGPA